MKKMAVICTLYGPNGGTGRVTTEIFERYAKDGNEVHVFCAEYDEEFAKNSAVTAITKIPITSVGLLQQVHLLIKSSLRIKKKDFDIVYTTGDYYWRPDIVTVHILKKYGRRVIEQLERQGVLRSMHSGVKRMARLIYCPLFFEIGEQFVYRREDTTFICVSKGVESEFCEEFDRKSSDRIYTITNGVDAEKNRFCLESRMKIRRELGLSDTDKTLLFVGSDWNRKRLDVAIALCARHHNLHLIVAGHDQAASYKQLAEQMHCAERIHFVGFRKDIEAFYSAGDYFLFTSVYETFGLVAIEAMAAGMVVISNRLNGVEDFICSGENGFLTDSGSVDAFDEKLSFILDNPEVEKKIRENAVKTAGEYCWDHTYAQYKILFDCYTRGG